MRITIFFAAFLFSITLFGQDFPNLRHDYIWLFGYQSWATPTDSVFGNYHLDFRTNPPTIYRDSFTMDFYLTNASIADKSGHLLFFTNGNRILNRSYAIMENGDSLCQNNISYNWGYDGQPNIQGALILPMPGDANKYILLQQERSDTSGGEGISFLTYLGLDYYYSVIDMSYNNYHGKVIEKSVPLVHDTLEIGKITACRHANGRDWWILVHEYDTNWYYRFLLDNVGIHTLDPQIIGENMPSDFGQVFFTPDGNKYIMTSIKIDVVNLEGPGTFVSIYDFDRCTGLLSNQRIKNFVQEESYIWGAAASPNSQFLYTMADTAIAQYDLLADDIFATRTTVAVYDGFVSPFATGFAFGVTAPDGKIYGIPGSSVNVMHVINHPNERGLACDVCQHCVQLPTYNAFSVPNFANYRLGPLDGSPCDTLGIDNPPPASVSEEQDEVPTVRLYPNPASQLVFVQYADPQHDTKLLLYNALGELVLERPLAPLLSNIDIQRLASGIYFYSIVQHGKTLAVGKIIKQT
ncbi:MAG: T9SS type A sorting domain-containing protein [Saprospiraceae bacterium]|nr:T9SS type A sorting domain-containing protein [Saprospiraceae bacterium]MBP7699508.1 T9SS type A sorting domain-containing protein [Saprospiraceae bacterium]